MRHECLRIRQHPHETGVPAYSSARTRDTCACVFVSTHTRHVYLHILYHPRETGVPAYSSPPIRDTCACVFVNTTFDTCACVFVSTHTRHVFLRIRLQAHETRAPVYSSTLTCLVWVFTSTLCACCIACVLQHALYRTCCPRRVPAPPSKPRVHGPICAEHLRPLEHN
jgi:hypothetical protein